MLVFGLPLGVSKLRDLPVWSRGVARRLEGQETKRMGTRGGVCGMATVSMLMAISFRDANW